MLIRDSNLVAEPTSSTPHEGTTMKTLLAATTRRSGPRGESGMNTAEYAVGTVGACGFATVLYQILTSEFGTGLLKDLFDKVVDILPF